MGRISTLLILLAIVCFCVSGCKTVRHTSMCEFTPVKVESQEKIIGISSGEKQFKVPIRIVTNSNLYSKIYTSAIHSVDNANELFRDLQFELVEVSYVKQWENKYYHDCLYGDFSLEVQKQNEDTLINVYVFPRLQNHTDQRIAHVNIYTPAIIASDGLCYWSKEYEDDPNTIFMSEEAIFNLWTLAHELGHYFNLDHCKCCSEEEKKPECYKNRMNEIYTYCDAVFTEEQQNSIFNFIPYRECVIYNLNHTFVR